MKRHELRADRSFFSCRRQLNDSLRAVPLAMATATELVWTGAGTEAPTGATDFQKAVWPNAGYYESLRASLRLTDFNPLTVDWTKPVPWGNDPATCDSENMSEDKGCMMPLGVGLCARPPSCLPIAHPNMRAPPAQRHCLGLWIVLLRCDDRSHFRARTPTPLPSRLRLLTCAHHRRQLEAKFAHVKMTSEHFNTAGRDVKTGLTAAVIVSQWTWAATLLQSSNVAWNFGISGPFWYASGASIQVLLFGVLAIEVKRKAPTCHTFLEMVKARSGKI